VPFAIDHGKLAHGSDVVAWYHGLDNMLEYHGRGEAANLRRFELAVWTDCIRIELIQPECSAQLIDPRKL
jgi:hypothetical protein